MPQKTNNVPCSLGLCAPEDGMLLHEHSLAGMTTTLQVPLEGCSGIVCKAGMHGFTPSA